MIGGRHWNEYFTQSRGAHILAPRRTAEMRIHSSARVTLFGTRSVLGMETNNDPVCILLADDDPDDRMLTERALKRSRLASSLQMVEDGEELMQYLRREGPYADPRSAPRPGLILLDLNMPRMDGREALQEIKSDESLRRIPVIVLTTSEAEQDILRSYDLGVNAFVTKPVTFDALATAIQRLSDFWFEIVKLPRAS